LHTKYFRRILHFDSYSHLLFGEAEEEYLVTEVELIEPELFFRVFPSSATRLADAITELLDTLASPSPAKPAKRQLCAEPAKNSKKARK
jgi:hypothetical protein